MPSSLDLEGLKSSAQQYSKSTVDSERRELGEKTIAAALQVCDNLLDFAVGATNVELACKALSYPLANSTKMHEKGALELCFAFSTVLSLHLNIVQTYEQKCDNIGGSKPICKAEGEASLSKCTVHLAQHTAAQAAKLGRCGPSLGNIDARALQRLIQCLNVVLSTPSLALLSSSSALSADQKKALLNYVADTAFGFAAALDSAAAVRNRALADACAALSDPKHQSGQLLGAKRVCVTSSVVDPAAVLRDQALDMVHKCRPYMSFGAARAFEVCTRLLKAHGKKMIETEPVFRDKLQDRCTNLCFSTLRFCERWIEMDCDSSDEAISTSDSRASSAFIQSQAQDYLRCFLFLRECSGYAADAAGHLAPIDTRTSSKYDINLNAQNLWKRVLNGKVNKMALLAKSSRVDLTIWKLMCTSLYSLSSGLASASDITSATKTVMKLCSNKSVLSMYGSLGMDAVAALCVSCAPVQSPGTSAPLCLSRLALTMTQVIHDCSVNEGFSESKRENVDSRAEGSKKNMGIQFIKTLVGISGDSLTLLSSRSNATEALSTDISSAVHVLKYATAVLDLLSLGYGKRYSSVPWEEQVPAIAALLRSVGVCLSSIPLAAFQEACRSCTSMLEINFDDSMTSASEKIAETEQIVGHSLLKALARAVPAIRLHSSHHQRCVTSTAGAGSSSKSSDIEENLLTLLTMLSIRCSLNSALPEAHTSTRASAAADGAVAFGCCEALLVTLFPINEKNVSSSLGSCSDRLYSALSSHTLHYLVLADGASEKYQELLGLYQGTLANAQSSTLSYVFCCKRHMLATSLTQNFAAQAAVVAKCGPAVIDFCMSFISEISRSAVASANGSVECSLVAEVQELYLSSHFCWAAQLGPGSELGSSIIGKIKTLCAALDSAGQPTINAVAKSRGRSKKSSKTSAADDVNELNACVDNCKAAMEACPALRHVMCSRLWLLLCKWSGPVTSSSDDKMASDGQLGIAVYLTNTLCAAQLAVKHLGEDGEAAAGSTLALSVPPPVISSLIVHSDLQGLYFSLGLFGRLSDQRECVALVEKLMSSMSSNVKFSGNLSDSALKVLCRMQNLWLGSSAGLPSGENKESDNSISSWFTELNAILDTIETILLSPLDKEPETPLVTLCNAVDGVLTSLSRAGRSGATGYTGSMSASMQAVRAWTAMLCAKASIYVYCDRAVGLYWARKALSATVNSHEPLALGQSASDGRRILFNVDVETALPRLESVLLIAEILEQGGNIESALSYTAEALALSSVGSSALTSLVSLHNFRLWYRTGSSRLVQCLNEVLCTESKNSSTVELRDEITPKVRENLRFLTHLLCLNVGDRNTESELSEKNFKSFKKKFFSEQRKSKSDKLFGVLSYRHLHRLWNIPALLYQHRPSDDIPHRTKGGKITKTLSEPDEMGILTTVFNDFTLDAESDQHDDYAPSVVNFYHACLPYQLRCGINELLLSSVQVPPDSKTSSASTLLPLTQKCGSFDVIRDLRRRRATDIISSSTTRKTPQSGAMLDSILPVVLASASCGTSFESDVEVGTSSQHIQSSKRGSTPRSYRTDVSYLVKQACLGEDVALGAIKECMDHLLCNLSTQCDSSALVVTVTMEMSTGNVLISRYDSKKGHYIAALPIASEVKRLLSEWAKISVDAKMNLQQTTDLQEVTKWTDMEKRQWWKKREAFDADIADILQKLQNLLGNWKLLFDPACSRECLLSLESLCTGTFSTNRTSSDTAVHNRSSVADLRKELRCRGLSSVGTKAELLTRLQSVNSFPDCESRADSAGSAEKMVLILDEHLQTLPWECMPCMRAHDCTRVPGLALLLSMSCSLYMENPGEWLQGKIHAQMKAHSTRDPSSGRKKSTCCSPVRSSSKSPLRESSKGRTSDDSVPISKFRDASGGAVVDISNSWFCVDPENNLPNTQKTMVDFLEPYRKTNDWVGFVGEIPSDAIVRCRHDDSSLFIFCGHGAGEKVCDSHKLRKCYAPSALLWGCSSGHLSVRGIHDPDGTALQYLSSGAPFVVANLWDVTDKDIDKLSMQCMKKIFVEHDDACKEQIQSTSLASALMQARDVCKMAYAVGSAPVIYGLPTPAVLARGKKST